MKLLKWISVAFIVLASTLTYNATYALETVDEQVLYLNNEGYSGSLRGMLLSYYNDQNGDISYALEDAQYKFLINAGFCCTIPDMLKEADSYFTLVDTYWNTAQTDRWSTPMTALWSTPMNTEIP